MQAASRILQALVASVVVLALAACGGAATPASSAPAAASAAASKPAAAPSSPAPVASSAAAKPAASGEAKPAASASAKPAAASGAASGAASAKPAASGAAEAKPAASGSAAAKPAASGAAAALPAIPAPVAVSVDPKTTAFLVLDINGAVCPARPSCVASVPTIAAFLKKARDAKMPVVYSTTPVATGGNNPILPEVAPQPDEPVVSGRADKLIGTDLDNILKKANATTLVMVGAASNGAVLYTAFHANVLGYTVAVAIDGISAEPQVDTVLAEYQLLHQPGFANADNKPLAEKMVTLTRTDLITIK